VAAIDSRELVLFFDRYVRAVYDLAQEDAIAPTSAPPFLACLLKFSGCNVLLPLESHMLGVPMGHYALSATASHGTEDVNVPTIFKAASLGRLMVFLGIGTAYVIFLG